MKSLLILVACVITLSLSAQKLKLDEKSIVKDSSGTVYPYAVWQALLMKGDYSIKAEDPKNGHTAFLLVHLSDAQKQARPERMEKPRESKFFTTGKEISLFNTRDIDNNKLNLKEAKGNIIVLNFWFINCGPCRKEIPDLNALVDSFQTNEKVVFVAVALDKKTDLQNFLEKMHFKYKIVDDGRFIADQYGIHLYPTHVIVDTEGKVYFHTSGLALNTVHWIKKSIQELLMKEEKTASVH